MSEKIQVYTGVDLQKELAEQSHKDWFFGGQTKQQRKVFKGEDRTPTVFDGDLPFGELQKRGDRDKLTCTDNGGLLNPYATLMNNKIRRGLITPQGIEWLNEKRYLGDDGRFNGSERFSANISGTGPAGNSLKAPYEAARLQGIIPEEMFPYVNNYNEYFDKSKVTAKMYLMGKEFLEHFPFNYDKVWRWLFDQVVKWSVIGVVGHAWDKPVNGIYLPTSKALNHAFELYKLKYFIHDTYWDAWQKDDFIKQLSPNFNFMAYGYRPIITETKHWKTTSIAVVDEMVHQKGAWLKFWEMWKARFYKIKGALSLNK